ncbi:unnamed protein product [Anisakis simplex]|uniref:Phosphatidic acid phosphatase type 2/haloperoxidase domain-containing protein n=1 Tax=Anisakis simplex TaxID=6269 RepID=A0A3P6QGG8_ANISI|nr:unnamed protein product [Anisakis simplex]
MTEMYRSTCILELYSWKGYNIKPVFANSLKYYGYQLLALLLTFTAAQVTKYATGRLRPHFLDVCKPGVDLDGCQTEHKFLESYKCGGGDEGLIRSARMSFFSGHASLSLTAAVFLVLSVSDLCALPTAQEADSDCGAIDG